MQLPTPQAAPPTPSEATRVLGIQGLLEHDRAPQSDFVHIVGALDTAFVEHDTIGRDPDLRPEAKTKRQRDLLEKVDAEVLVPFDRATAALEGEVERTTNQALTLVPDGKGAYVQRRPDIEPTPAVLLLRDHVWRYVMTLPVVERASLYIDAIRNGDRDTVEAIEAMPRLLRATFMDEAVAARGRAAKVEYWLAPEHAQAIVRGQLRIAARHAVSERARRHLRDRG
jgi:hypothetical protein